MIGVRRKARAIALQALYEIDSSGHEVGEVLNRLLADEGLSEDNSDFTRELVSGVIENKEKIDENIKKYKNLRICYLTLRQVLIQLRYDYGKVS